MSEMVTTCLFYEAYESCQKCRHVHVYARVRPQPYTRHPTNVHCRHNASSDKLRRFKHFRLKTKNERACVRTSLRSNNGRSENMCATLRPDQALAKRNTLSDPSQGGMSRDCAGKQQQRANIARSTPQRDSRLARRLRLQRLHLNRLHQIQMERTQIRRMLSKEHVALQRHSARHQEREYALTSQNSGAHRR